MERDATKFYAYFFPEEDKVTMQGLEEEVFLTREFKDDEEVEFQVWGLIPNLDLGCTRTMNSKFFRTLELYWHMKTMVALGMIPKEEGVCHLKGRLKALETQNACIIKVVTWLACCHGEVFVPPVGNKPSPKYFVDAP
jgi:hypothetical protein